MISLDSVDHHTHIIIKGARVHNLKNLSVAIPRNQLVVITGLSGSGKSSLAFDTLYAEGQRRYVESLSAYARQFLGRMSKPEVDYIKGISPAVAIEQKVNTRNPRSTVGTSTEIYEYLKLLFARIGKTYSPVSGQLVLRHQVKDVVDHVLSLSADVVVNLFAPFVLNNGRKLADQLGLMMQQGFTRVRYEGDIYRIEELLQQLPGDNRNDSFDLLIDRIVTGTNDDSLRARLSDSVETAFFEGNGKCLIEYEIGSEKSNIEFSSKFDADGIVFEEPSANLFSFNNPYGACKNCEGFGLVMGIDEDLVVPDKSLSIFDEAIACWKGEKMSEWKDQLVRSAYKFNFPIHKPFYELTPEQRKLLWTGNEYFNGLDEFFRFVEANNFKIQYRVMMSRYRGKTTCPECQGTRLRKDASYVKINGFSINDIVLMQAEQALATLKNLELSEYELTVASRLLTEIINRLQYLCNVGLNYLTLNRLSNSLSGGESQRINLATSLGSSLVGSMYILDEPSIGLHPHDTRQLIKVLKQLRDLGNTVIVVEHDEEIIRAADQVIDIGPLAGEHGGELIFQGNWDSLIASPTTLTGKYLSGEMKIAVPEKRRKWKEFIEVAGARENNLKNITVKFPLRVLTAVTGVSGSGKTSLVKKVFYSALRKVHGGYADKTGKHDRLDGDIRSISTVELVDQNPIGRSSRSNPATYVKAWDDIRQLYAGLPLAQMRGYKPGYFSFNIEGGRCEECEGEGIVRIEMQFMADIELVCDSCHGRRFKDEVLDVTYLEKNIADILDMSIEQAITFFGTEKKQSANTHRISARLQPLADVGLGYLRLGQSSSTLSGGEAQRIKLAFFLAKGHSETPTLFIFDEPTTGLHYHDISKLMLAFEALIARNHTVIVVEHNMEVIKCADWIIDLGPEGGDTGGEVVFEGTPEQLVQNGNSFTASYLKDKLLSLKHF
ncbi:MAG: excinuclease ABC subunit UvrA [Bacteroidales bacterium]|nr:excinuclease ABC subunit UvrA [Bacteroidales bacterium]